MVNWEHIHKDFIDFNRYYQKQWESNGFSYEQAKEWINVGFSPRSLDNVTKWKSLGFTAIQAKTWVEKGLEPYWDYDFAYYLKKDGYQPSDLDKDNLEELEKKCSWQDIHEKFSFGERNNWEKNGFDYHESKRWINIGFAPHDCEKARIWKDYGFTSYQAKEWIRKGLKLREPEFSSYLRQNNYWPDFLTSGYLVNLRKEFYPNYSTAQKYLDQNYTLNQTKNLKELNLCNLNLGGDLDLSDFDSLREININGNPRLGKITDKKQVQTVIKAKAQDWINWKYLNKRSVKQVKTDWKEKIEDGLIVSNFPNLEEISISGNQVTSLQLKDCPRLKAVTGGHYCSRDKISELVISNCPNLAELNCDSNRLVSLNFLIGLNKRKLEQLNLNDNLIVSDLVPFSSLVNLKELYLGGYSSRLSRFNGSLEPLS